MLSGWSAPCLASPARASVLPDPARRAVSRESQEMVPICKNQRYVGIRASLRCIIFSVTLVKMVLCVCISFLHAGIKQAEEGAAEAGEEEATRGKASAEVSPEQRTSGPEPA